MQFYQICLNLPGFTHTLAVKATSEDEALQIVIDNIHALGECPKNPQANVNYSGVINLVD